MSQRSFYPTHAENRMRHEGDIAGARALYFNRPSANLRLLLRHRYEWMNQFIGPDDEGIEVGCGTGLSKEFIQAKKYYLTDAADFDWLDYRHVDALATPFADASFNFVVASNMIHHTARPLAFFGEMQRILLPGGRLIIQEVNASLVMRMMLRLMRHEGYSYDCNVFDPEVICNDPHDLWSANCAIPNLLFDDMAKFEQHVPAFTSIHSSFSECTCMINSGGVIAKTFYIPLPAWVVRLMIRFDAAMAGRFPSLVAMQRQVVLQSRDAEGASATESRQRLPFQVESPHALAMRLRSAA
ncbi:MAG: class I SAM-dependent methyltransferase [Planctomycetia bacterium]|nr:class I SAM-dependent methyltransferase [Planctomycetia bacterium]